MLHIFSPPITLNRSTGQRAPQCESGCERTKSKGEQRGSDRFRNSSSRERSGSMSADARGALLRAYPRDICGVLADGLFFARSMDVDNLHAMGVEHLQPEVNMS